MRRWGSLPAAKFILRRTWRRHGCRSSCPRCPGGRAALCKAPFQTVPGSGAGPECFQALRSPPGLPQSPMLCTGGSSSPNDDRAVWGVQGLLRFSPGPGCQTSKEQRSHTRRPPLGQPQVNVPRATRGGNPSQLVQPEIFNSNCIYVCLLL